MCATYRLPDAQRLALMDATTSAVKDALKDACNIQQGERPALQDVIAAVKDCILGQLADICRTHNTTQTSRERLPPEIWALIWRHLPHQDRISITHVCHRWRTLALSIPAVWSSIEFLSDVHASHCNCDLCEARDQDYYYCTATRTARPALTNLRSMPEILARGRQSPVSLTVRLLDHRADAETILTTFGKLLIAHASRLTSIDIVLAPLFGLGDFFENFECLPALRSLKLDYTGEGDDDIVAGPAIVIHQHISMPCLRFLDIGSSLDFPRREHIDFPALTHLTASFSSVAELRGILEACPVLQHLEVHPFSNGGEPEATAEEIELLAPLVKRLRGVRILSVSREALGPSLAIFAHRILPDLQINCADISTEVLPRAMDILADVSSPMQFGFSTSGDLLVLTTANDAGQQRVLGTTIHALDGALQHVWDVVRAPSLWFFCTSWALWLRVCGNIGRATQLQHIVIVLPHGNTHPLPAPDVPGACFERLITLALHSAPHPTDKARVPLSWIRGVVRSLCLGRPLERLYLVNVAFTLDDDDSLSDEERFDISFVSSIRDMTGRPGFGGFLGP